MTNWMKQSSSKSMKVCNFTILSMTSNVLSYNSTLSLYVITKAMDVVVLVAPPGYVADGEHDDDICGDVIDYETAGMIANTEQKPELNVQIISSAANDDGNDD
jgi:hypothetical protein